MNRSSIIPVIEHKREHDMSIKHTLLSFNAILNARGSVILHNSND